MNRFRFAYYYFAEELIDKIHRGLQENRIINKDVPMYLKILTMDLYIYDIDEILRETDNCVHRINYYAEILK